MKKITRKKLTVTTATLRPLTLPEESLAGVHGGQTRAGGTCACTRGCPPPDPTCPSPKTQTIA